MWAELDCALQVEAMKRRDMYQRNQLLHKIQSETEKAHDLLEQRTSLQQQRKMANMTASFQRQKLLQVRCGLLQAACRPAGRPCMPACISAGGLSALPFPTLLPSALQWVACCA